MPLANDSTWCAGVIERPRPRLVVFACGNPSRGDDALGPKLLERIARLDMPGATLIEDFQLQIEHALDLEAADRAIFIDAGIGTLAPFSFAPISPSPTIPHATHALEPADVLATFVKITGRPSPPAFVLCVRGYGFDLGAPLSVGAEANLEAAWTFIEEQLKLLTA